MLPSAVADGEWRESVNSLLPLYDRVRPEHRYYARNKVRFDPIYRRVCERLGQVWRIVDLGTGLAMLPALLALRRQAREILAVDWDETKIASARLACSALPAVIVHAADARTFALPASDAVCIIDLLHYFPVEEQRALLGLVGTALRPGGWIVIRETVQGRRALPTRVFERLAMRIRWNRGPGLAYRAADDFVDDLEAQGLECSLESASKGPFRGNFMLWARKPFRPVSHSGRAPGFAGRPRDDS
jgi:SAM-dependent methyltransferase